MIDQVKCSTRPVLGPVRDGQCESGGLCSNAELPLSAHPGHVSLGAWVVISALDIHLPVSHDCLLCCHKLGLLQHVPPITPQNSLLCRTSILGMSSTMRRMPTATWPAQRRCVAWIHANDHNRVNIFPPPGAVLGCSQVTAGFALRQWHASGLSAALEGPHPYKHAAVMLVISGPAQMMLLASCVCRRAETVLCISHVQQGIRQGVNRDRLRLAGLGRGRTFPAKQRDRIFSGSPRQRLARRRRRDRFDGPPIFSNAC